MKGVVGRTGKKIPMTPIPTISQAQPRMSRRIKSPSLAAVASTGDMA